VRSWRRYILAAACGGFLLAFLVFPIALAIRAGFFEQGRFTTYWLARVFADLAAREGLINSFKVAAATTAGVFLLALPLAVLASQCDFRGRGLASAMLMVPMILPPFVGALAIRKLLAHEGGSVNLMLQALGLGKVDWLGSGFSGVVILEVLHLYPIMFLNASAALANVDPTVVEAARSLGASRWKTFRRITLPLIRPGLFAGGTIVFIWSFTELGTPLMVGYEQVLPVQIYHGLNVPGVSAKTFSMVFVMLSASVGMYGVGKLLFGRGSGAMPGRGVAATERKSGPLATVGIWLIFGLVTLVAVLPHVGIVLMSFAGRWSGTILPESYTLRYVREVFANPETWNSILNSLRYASLATVIDIVGGLAIAYLVVRLRVRGGAALDALAMLPLAVPGLVIASGFVALLALGWHSDVGEWIRQGGSALAAEGARMAAGNGGVGGLLGAALKWLGGGLGSVGAYVALIGPRGDPTIILIIAYSVRRLPYMVRSISAGLQQTSETLEEAARNLGAGPLRSVLRITVPLISANVLAGAILAFSFAMLEVSDSLILAQTQDYYPITKQIYTLAGIADTQNLAAALGMFGMGLLTATLVGANLLLGRRLGALFRV